MTPMPCHETLLYRTIIVIIIIIIIDVIINQLKALKLIAITLPVMSRKRMSLLIKNCFSLVKIPKINIY